MKQQLKYGLLLGVLIIIYSCSAPKYIHDNSSFNRQKELINTRSANVFGDILIGSLSFVSSAYLGAEVEFQPTMQNFKRMNLINPTTDTIYVNMLTDVFWDKNDYCDFMDIRIPPEKNYRILVPVNAEYNIYFSKTPESDDDEMLKINTSETTQIKFKPGITLTSESN
jgi:hypothetical protein